MVKTNEAAIKVLTQRGWMDSTVEKMVEDLVEAGLLEADPDPRTPAEQFAEAAQRWIDNVGETTAAHVFDCAAGWSTASWQHVIDAEGLDFKLSYPQDIKHVFDAMVILAKDAGRVL